MKDDDNDDHYISSPHTSHRGSSMRVHTPYTELQMFVSLMWMTDASKWLWWKLSFLWRKWSWFWWLQLSWIVILRNCFRSARARWRTLTPTICGSWSTWNPRYRGGGRRSTIFPTGGFFSSGFQHSSSEMLSWYSAKLSDNCENSHDYHCRVSSKMFPCK